MGQIWPKIWQNFFGQERSIFKGQNLWILKFWGQKCFIFGVKIFIIFQKGILIFVNIGFILMLLFDVIAVKNVLDLKSCLLKGKILNHIL